MLFCSLAMNARELSWTWWPTGFDDSVTAGNDSLHYSWQVGALVSGGRQAPFWLQNNQHGDVSSSPYSGNLNLCLYKNESHPERWWDYDFAVQLTARLQSHIPSINQPIAIGYFNQLYAHIRLLFFDLTAGIKPLDYSAGDPALSCGNLLFSTNAHAFPRITIGIDKWTAIPGLFGYAEIKGGLTHGWLGDNAEVVSKTLLHHKFIGGRVGGRLPVNVSYEFHHVAQWGGYSTVYGDLGNNFNAWLNALLVHSGGTMRNDQINAQGNHIGYQQLTMDVKGDGWIVSVYWQTINEDGPIRFIGKGMNAKDGLWGVCLQQTRWLFISGITYEFVNTTDQSGPFHDKDGCVYGGNDSYYTNSIYTQGWTYFGRNLGSPLLSQDNTRVMAHHIGIKGDIFGWRYRTLCTYTDNYGTYLRPISMHNTALLLEVKKCVPQAWNLEFGVALCGDFGNQFGNRFGAMLTICKQGLICKW